MFIFLFLQVDTMQKLSKILMFEGSETNNNQDNTMDYSCVLVKCDSNVSSDDNLELNPEMCKLINTDDIIELPE